MKAKRQTRTTSISGAILDGNRGQVNMNVIRNKTASKDVARQNYNMPAAFVLMAVVFACFASGTNQAYAQEQKQKVIYFLSGLRDHASPTVGGRHEVAKDLLVLQD